MKNRKQIITAFVLVAIMLLSVGYAALNDTLDMTGTADITASQAEEAFNEDVHFSGVKIGGNYLQSAFVKGDGTYDTVKADGVTYMYSANINANNNDKAQYTITGLKGQGDTITITFGIVNNGDVDATLNFSSSSNNNSQYFDFETSLKDGDPALTLNPGQTVDVSVTVSLKETPTEAISATFVFEVKATSTN